MIIFIVVLFSSAVFIWSSYFIYKNAEEATLQALQMQAIGITITLNGFLQESGIEKLKESAVFSEILLDERWQGVAFISLYSAHGTVILHSNPVLIGKRMEEVINIFTQKSPYYHFIVLGTGEKVFVSDSIIELGGIKYLLRVALHKYPAETALRNAKMQILIMTASAILIISGGILAVMLLRRMERMQMRMRELENISMISRILAHEIRNPLGSIKGFAQHLSKKITEQSLKQYLDIIIKESLRLEKFTDELSLYANPQKIDLEKINLKNFLNEIILPFINQNETVEFKIKADDIHIKTDIDKLKQILNNIIQNAVDAVNETSQKRVIITAMKLNGKIEIEIKDSGTGMDEGTLNQVLEPFFTTKPRGTGLGLAIVKKLCDSLKIDIQMRSKKGEGTEVCLTLPEFP